MKVKKFFTFFLCFTLVFTAVPFYSNATDLSEYEQGEYADGRVSFLYTQTVENESDFCSENNLPEELKKCGINSVKELPVSNIYDTEIKTNPDGTLTKSSYLVGFTDEDVPQCCAELDKLYSTDKVSPDYFLYEDTVSIPTEISSPTKNFTSYTKWWFEQLHITEAWQQYDTMGEGTVVAVIDSGLYVDNPEIKNNIWEDKYGHRGFDAANLTYDASPATSHGGNVAGIIASEAGHNLHLIGVAPEAKIMPIKVSTNGYAIISTAVVTGINYAIANGADIITMSLSARESESIASLEDACNAAYDSGIIVFSSAGNSGKNTSEFICYPAAYSSVISVMAYGTNHDSVLCNFSNYDSTHNYYNIAAPGYAILGLPMDPTSITMGTLMAGTSQSTPIVAGIAALYLSVYPDHTPAEFKNALMKGCTDTVTSNPVSSPSQTYTFQRIDALKLLGYYSDSVPEVTNNPGTTVVVDDEKDVIYGFSEEIESINDYITVRDGDSEFIPTENGKGTGSLFRVYTLGGNLYKEYRIIVFGDLDGDAKYDGMDAVYCSYFLENDDMPDYLSFACDVDFNNAVTQDDYNIIFGCGIYSDFVTQIR